MWGKIMIPMYRLIARLIWTTWTLLSPKRPLNLITHSQPWENITLSSMGCDFNYLCWDMTQLPLNIVVPEKERLRYNVSIINDIAKIWSQLNTGTIKSMHGSAWILPFRCLKSPGKVLEFHFGNSVLTLTGHFQTVTPVWIHQRLQNDAKCLT